jgi:RHS repeat-associated protein
MAVTTRLLQLDSKGTVTRARAHSGNVDLGYSVYGLNVVSQAFTPLSRFNGQYLELSSGHYLLGNGYRGYNPVLMRFNSPDSYSPFGAGGLNGFAYCAGDPVNRTDPSGHTHSFKSLLNGLTGKAKPGPALTGYRRLSGEFDNVPTFSAGVLAKPTAPTFDDLSWSGSLSSLTSDYTHSAPPVSEFVRRHSSASQDSEHIPSAPSVAEFVRRTSLESIMSNYLPSAPMSDGTGDLALQTGGVVHPQVPTTARPPSNTAVGQLVREAG